MDGQQPTATPHTSLREKLTGAQTIAFNAILVALGIIYLYTDIANLATLQLALYKDGDLDLQYVFDIVIWDSVEYLWNSTSYLIAIIIFIFSLIWPYLQLIILFIFIWIKVNPIHSTKAFYIIHLTAKIPLINTLYIICLTNIMTMDLEFTLLSAEYTGFIDIEIQTAFILFTIATILLMITSIILSYLNKTRSVSLFESDRNDRSWFRCHTPLILKPKITCKKVFLLIILGISIFMAICTYSTPLCTVEFYGGMSDYMVDSVGEYTIIDLGIFSAVYEYNYSNIYGSLLAFTAVIYICLVVFIPLLLFASLLMVWLLPIPTKCTMDSIKFYLWSLYACNGLDLMFVIAITIALEFPRLYDYLVFDEYGVVYCDELESYFDETCPSMNIIIGNAMWFCLLAVIGLNIVVYYTVFVVADDKNKYDDEYPIADEYIGSEVQPLNTNDVEYRTVI